MSKILTLLAFFNFFLISFSYSEIVASIEIDGNQRISDETIIVIGNLKINENYDDIKLNNTFDKLFSSNFFKDLILNLENNILKIKVEENPIIENIEIVGIKSKQFKTFI